MSHPYLLALDLGTSSIGHVAFSLDTSNQPTGILDLGVRIFSDGRDPKTKEPLAVSRRTARGIRRNRDRGQNRVRRLVKELIAFKLLPADENDRKKVFVEICPYQARNSAAKAPVDKHILARALFHIGRRRGFKSNRLADETEESEYKEKISALREKLSENLTLGQYLLKKMEENKKALEKKGATAQKVVRFRNGETDFYADRQMYQDEFNRIREIQGNTYLTDEGWDALEETIFWQYPLKPVPKGKCRFYPEETRAHIDLPITHEFRILQEINALRYVSQNVEYKLDERQRIMLYDALQNSKTLGFKALLKKKDEHKSPYFPSDASFNLDVPSRSGKLKGNNVRVDLSRPEYLGDLVSSLPVNELNDIVDYLIEPLKIQNEKKVVSETSEVAAWLINRLPSLTAEQVTKICSYRFKRDTASVSRKFMEQINPVLKDTGCVYSEAVAQIENAQGIKFHHSYFEDGEVFQKLPYYAQIMPESVWGEKPDSDKNKAPNERDEDAYQYGKIANPTVHVALNQLRVVVNRVIDRIGSAPAKIHIELTRDLKNSKEARKKIEQSQAKNKKNNERIRELLTHEFGFANPSREDIQKVKLWEELGKQGFRCSVFSGRPISGSQLFNGEVEIEHIIPFSRCYDDGMSNKTLAFKNENLAKGNKTPHEAFSGNTQFPYEEILKRALSSFAQSSKFDRFKPDSFESFYGGEKGDMIARQLNDTKYISRKAAQYLGCLCHRANVVSVNGRMTAFLRDVWQLNQFKDRESGHYRDDHRHHIVDAFVVGLTSKSLIQKLSTQRSTNPQNSNDLYHFLKDRAPDITKLKAELFENLGSVIASYKPDHSRTGSMFNETAYGFDTDPDGNPVCITRKPTKTLSYEEVFRIRGQSLRHQLLHFLTQGEGIDFDTQSIRSFTTQLKAHFKNEKDFAQALERFAQKTGIKKIRINVLNSSVQPIASAPFKGYGRNSYAYCDVWQIPDKRHPVTGEWSYKYEGTFVAYADVKKFESDPELSRPIDKNGKSHPAAKRLMRLFKNDNIRLIDRKTGAERVVNVAGYSTSANKLDIRNNILAGEQARNFVSINVIFSNNSVSKVRM